MILETPRRGRGRPRKVPVDPAGDDCLLDVSPDEKAELRRRTRELEALMAMFRLGEAGIRLPRPWTDAN